MLCKRKIESKFDAAFAMGILVTTERIPENTSFAKTLWDFSKGGGGLKFS